MTKSEKLNKYLKNLGSAAVAFSGGVDSVFLLKAARGALGNNVIAVTARSCLFPERELAEARDFCESEGIRHVVFDFDALSIDGLRENPVNRCYICKRALFGGIKAIAAKNGIKNILEGTNADDLNDFRPGLIAIRELDIKSPLLEAGLTKEEIRALSKELGLSSWEKQSMACLASRFEYGDAITREKLAAVDKAERFLLGLGFGQLRVRIKDSAVRIEVMPEEFEKLIQNRERVVSELNKLGFVYVSMDLKGYRTGSANEAIS